MRIYVDIHTYKYVKTHIYKKLKKNWQLKHFYLLLLFFSLYASAADVIRCCFC